VQKTRNKIITNILTVVISLIVLFFLTELALRFSQTWGLDKSCKYYSNENDKKLCALFDSLSKALQRYNQSTIINDQGLCDQWDSELGWSPKANCKTKKYSTNSRGFRGSDEFSYESDKPRIIVLGDSLTWGENNFDDETYPFYLSQLFDYRVDVINMGVHGYGPGQFYLRYLRDGAKFSHDVVVFGLYLPDIHRSSLRIRDYFKPKFIIENDALVLSEDSKIPSLDEALELSRSKKEEFRLYSLSRLYLAFLRLAKMLASYNKEVEVTLKIIEELNKKLQSDKIDFLVVFIPHKGMVEKFNKNYFGALTSLKEGLDRLRIRYLDTTHALILETSKSEESLYHGHLKPKGNQIIASEIHQYLNNGAYRVLVKNH